jgi:hypothetical protein
MHAVVIPVTFNDQSAAKGELDGLVPQVSGMPGFLAGYWVALSQDKGTAMIVFDSEESAQSLATVAQSAPAGAVTAGNIEVGEVMATARSH